MVCLIAALPTQTVWWTRVLWAGHTQHGAYTWPNLMIQPLGVSLTWPKFKAYSYSVSFIMDKNVQGGWGYTHSRLRHKVRIKYKVCVCVYVCEYVCMCMHTHICASGKLLYTYCVSVRNKVEANVFPVSHHLAHGLL